MSNRAPRSLGCSDSRMAARALGALSSAGNASPPDGSSLPACGAMLPGETVEEGRLNQIAIRIVRLESLLLDLVDLVQGQALTKDYYTTAEAAKILGKRPFTVREWCRLGRVRGEKAAAGRGIDAEWRISQAELTRIQNEGLLPLPGRPRHSGPRERA